MMISQDTRDANAERRKAQWNHARFAERKSLEDLGHQIIELAGHLLVIKARLSPESGQMFIKAIEAATEKLRAGEISTETTGAFPRKRHLSNRGPIHLREKQMR